ncbi:MAG: helix-turn-helix domain-containing protein [Actinomycetota bacterium]|nr:helix-turn-helix domain-containing protein [Actinomycetota bacterium]
MSTSEGDVRVQRVDPLLTPGEAAAYARLTVGQLAQLRYRGQGPVYLNPTPRRILYRRSDLDSWLYASERNITLSRR